MNAVKAELRLRLSASRLSSCCGVHFAFTTPCPQMDLRQKAGGASRMGLSSPHIDSLICSVGAAHQQWCLPQAGPLLQEAVC